mmetsp:Transcript_4144/g.9001  ORF Transcript_4144/g.9001 Transcript_4144/m.9001 type:complete len:106 (+) Transcript_4144:312-629(+)
MCASFNHCSFVVQSKRADSSISGMPNTASSNSCSLAAQSAAAEHSARVALSLPPSISHLPCPLPMCITTSALQLKPLASAIAGGQSHVQYCPSVRRRRPPIPQRA